ncbi:unnamed protein product, partial [Ectocarpus fasciculatus]
MLVPNGPIQYEERGVAKHGEGCIKHSMRSTLDVNCAKTIESSLHTNAPIYEASPTFALPKQRVDISPFVYWRLEKIQHFGISSSTSSYHTHSRRKTTRKGRHPCKDREFTSLLSPLEKVVHCLGD